MAVAVLTASLASITSAQSIPKIKLYIVSNETVQSSNEVAETLRQN
jgi:hypothetical protein